MSELTTKAIDLLKQLIAIPSFSKEESASADLIGSFFEREGIVFHRKGNNIFALNKKCGANKTTLLLNSHHDTVRPGITWTKKPFEAFVEDGKLFGLGSNDAGAALVSLIATFLYFYEKEISINLVLAATAEEEISGGNGIESILGDLGEMKAAIVGEPTQMNLAIAEKGLLVLDCISIGKTGHAARNEGENAIYKAIKDIQWFQTFEFPKISKWLGKVKMTVTKMEAGTQHNVVPAQCAFTVDIRVTDEYTLEEILEIVKLHVDCEITPRSLRLKSSSIDEIHPLVMAGKKMDLKLFGSPTLSDQTLLPFPSIKIGPGDSARSHTADEFIFLIEIEEGIQMYITLIEKYGTLVVQNKKETKLTSPPAPLLWRGEK